MTPKAWKKWKPWQVVSPGATLSDKVVFDIVNAINATKGPVLIQTTLAVYRSLCRRIVRHTKRSRRFPHLYRPFHPKRHSRMAGK